MRPVESASPCRNDSRLSPWQARGVLLCALAFFAFGLWVSPAPQKTYSEHESATSDDVLLYQAEIERMHAGENYYCVAAEELVARGFPTRSIFNWRTPLVLSIISSLPSPVWGRLILIGAAILLMTISIAAATRDEPEMSRFAMPLGLVLTAPLLQCFVGHQFVMTEVWAGMAIAISVAVYGIEQWLFAASIGLISLFLRELALPYCVVCLLLSIRQKRRMETVVWLLGLSAWVVYYSLHCRTVFSLIDSDAIAHRHGWVQFGGLAFVLGTVQVNYYLLTWPMPVTVAYLTLSLLGLGGWKGDWGYRISGTVMMYLVAFCVVGQDFNRYWGYLTVPLLCYGVARAPLSIWELLIAARWSPNSTRTEVINGSQNCVTAVG